MKKLLLSAALSVLPFCALAQETPERLDSVVVSASRAGKQTPVTYSTVTRDALQGADPSQSLPEALRLLPSVVTWNEGGTGLGNSAMTIRGSKGSQINVTLNGISLNDAESQEVFWVNIPSLSSLLSSVQVQRGLGTSANGAGAFGASINMNTAFVAAKPSFRADLSVGSYGTFIASLSGSTGLTSKGFYASAAYSGDRTDGYIRNAFVRAQSAFVALGWLRGNNSLRFTWLMGRQRSGITWDGIDLEQYEKDRRYNGAGKYKDDEGNVCYYDNQTDNYRQNHLQLNYTHAFTGGLTWSNTLNYTLGDGFDEYYKTARTLSEYGFPSGPGIPEESDLIYRKKMDNRLWVYQTSLRYRSRLLDVTGGLYLSQYDGGHWSEILWARSLGDSFDYASVDWYAYTGLKRELSSFIRAEYQPAAWLTAYADLQYRGLRYNLDGKDDDWLSMGGRQEDLLDYAAVWDFFNPRAGLTAHWGAQKLYLSAAWGHREPGRGDIKENVKGADVHPIVPEKMLDIELGWTLEGPAFSASANLYAMEYWDMLLETGRLSSAGYAIKENMPRAWRRGVELAMAWKPLSWLRLEGNTTLSQNEIADYTSYVPYDDYSGRTFAVSYGRTQMLASPSVIGMGCVSIFPWKGASAVLDGKYVGRQYLDNSRREEMAIPAYFVAGLQLRQEFRLRGSTVLALTGYVNNLLNHLYYASGWRWEAYDAKEGGVYSGVGVYPQAPRHFMIKATLSF